MPFLLLRLDLAAPLPLHLDRQTSPACIGLWKYQVWHTCNDSLPLQTGPFDRAAKAPVGDRKVGHLATSQNLYKILLLFGFEGIAFIYFFNHFKECSDL